MMYNGNYKIKNMYVHTDDVYRGYLGGNLAFANYEIMHMTFEIKSGGTITWRHNRTLTGDVGNLTIDYRINNGEWQSITSSTGGTSFNVNTGDRVLFRSTNSRLGSLPLSYNTFGDSTAVFEVYGNLFSMIYGDNFRGQTTVENQYEFNRLFAGAQITSAENLIIPATTVAMHCFTSMFEGCTLMTKAPSLLATTMENSCCNEMFKNCSSLSYIRCLAGDISAYNCTYNWVSGVAASGTFVKNKNMSGWGTGNSGIPNGWTVIDEDAPVPPGPDYSRMPLTFEIVSAGTINWRASNTALTKTIEYKLNDGEWTSITSNTGASAPTINVVEGDIVKFRGNNTAYATSASIYNTFSGSTAGFEIEGNIMSLIDSTGFVTATTIASNYAFCRLFYNCTGLTSVENFVLLATTLAERCYMNMFVSCTSLTTAPSILPATTLTNQCYSGMFNGCTGLTTAPELPATTLANYCYQGMFNNCSSLNYIKCLATDISASNCTSSWVNGVAATGTFVKNASMTGWTTGNNGIPSGWDVQDAS